MINLKCFPSVDSKNEETNIGNGHEDNGNRSQDLIIFYELDGTDREDNRPDKKRKRMRKDFLFIYANPVYDSTPKGDKKRE